MKVNQSDLIDQIAELEGDTSKADVRVVLERFQEVVTSHLRQGNSIALTSLGSIEPTHREARDGRNPSTGEAMKIAASNGAKLKVGKKLKEALN